MNVAKLDLRRLGTLACGVVNKSKIKATFWPHKLRVMLSSLQALPDLLEPYGGVVMSHMQFLFVCPTHSGNFLSFGWNMDRG